MKQSERLLVYLVTGFLAVILVIAVVFGREPGRDPAKKETNVGARSLDEMFTGDPAKGGADVGKSDAGKPVGGAQGANGTGNGTGLPSPSQVTPEQPLVAAPKANLAADLISQQLGISHRDHTVRMVRPRAGDSLSTLVRRWCGAVEPFLAEAKSLNEDMVVIRVGQEVAVPWVDDDVLLAAIEAQQPKTLLAENAGLNGISSDAVPATAKAPDFKLPGSGAKEVGSKEVTSKDDAGSLVSAATGSSTYTVKAGDALWKIAATKYGRKNADRMIPAIKAANPGLTEKLNIDQKIVLPADTR